MKIFSQLKGLFLEKLGTDPTTELDEGRLYWDTVAKSAKVYDGSAFNPVGGIDPAVQTHMDSTGEHGLSGTGDTTVFASYVGGGTTINVSSYPWGEDFLSAATGQVNFLGMVLKAAGATGTFKLALYNVVTGVPQLTPFATTDPIDVANIGLGYSLVTGFLSAPTTLTSGTQYLVAIDPSGLTGGTVSAGAQSAGYPGGTRWRLFFGSWQVQSDFDLGFTVEFKEESGASTVFLDSTKSYTHVDGTKSIQDGIEKLDSAIGGAIVLHSTIVQAVTDVINVYDATQANGTTSMPSGPLTGDKLTIKFGALSGLHQRKIAGSGYNIDGQTEYLVNSRSFSSDFIFTGTEWIKKNTNIERFSTYLTAFTGQYEASSEETLILTLASALAPQLRLPRLQLGRRVKVIETNNFTAGNNISVLGRSSETINGAAAPYLIAGEGIYTFVCDGSQWTVEATGSAYTSATKILASYTTNLAQSLPNATHTLIDYQTKIYDEGSGSDSVTVGAAWKFTAPRSGKYLVTGAVLLQSASGWAETETTELHIWKNNTNIQKGARTTGMTGTNFMQAMISIVVEMNKDDFVDLRCYQNNGAALTLITSGAYNYVQVTEVS